MTIQQLEYVLALDKHRLFTKAADSVHVTQPTLTMQMRKLEDELGFEIFDRSKKPLQPTEAGLKVIDHARSIVDQVSSMKTELGQEESLVEGDIHLGVIPTLAPYLLPLFLEFFVEEHARARLIVSEMQSEHMMEEINSGRLDLGLLVTPLNNVHLVERPLFYEPFWFYAPEGHHLLNQKEVCSGDLLKEDLWILSQGHCFREQVLNICKRDNSYRNIEYQSGSIETIKNLVNQGNRSTLIPELSISNRKEKGQSRPFSNPKPVREVSLVYSKGYAKKGIVNALHDSICAALPKSIRTVERKKRILWR